MVQNQIEYNKKNQGWVEWGFSFFQPFSWFGSSDSSNGDQSVEKFVHFESLRVFFGSILLLH